MLTWNIDYPSQFLSWYSCLKDFHRYPIVNHEKSVLTRDPIRSNQLYTWKSYSSTQKHNLTSGLSPSVYTLKFSHAVCVRTAFSSQKTTSAEVTAAKWERGRTPITEPDRSSCLIKRVSCCLRTTCMLLKLFSICEENRVLVEAVSRAIRPNWRPSVHRASLRMFLPHPECAPAVHWRSFCWALALLLFLLIAQRSSSVLLCWWPCELVSWFFSSYFLIFCDYFYLHSR